jgi:hypothetical protein
VTGPPGAAAALPLSAVAATTQPWPEVRPLLESLREQIAAVGGEIVLGDGSAEGLPDEVHARYPRLRVIHRAGASVFQLRAACVAASAGAIVAITEDHCVAARDWCERILAAHREHPEAAVIGGAVENGATATTIDWASFFLVNGASMPPVRDGARRAIALQANCSYKRSALSKDAAELGMMEWLLNEDLHARGAVLRTDGAILVEHVQSLGVAATCRIHYDDGRTIAAFRLARIGSVERVVRLAACVAMPPLLTARAALQVLAKRRRTGLLLASLPWMLVLTTCKAWGNLHGFLFGAGTSPARIR